MFCRVHPCPNGATPTRHSQRPSAIELIVLMVGRSGAPASLLSGADALTNAKVRPTHAVYQAGVCSSMQQTKLILISPIRPGESRPIHHRPITASSDISFNLFRSVLPGHRILKNPRNQRTGCRRVEQLCKEILPEGMLTSARQASSPKSSRQHHETSSCKVAGRSHSAWLNCSGTIALSAAESTQQQRLALRWRRAVIPAKTEADEAYSYFELQISTRCRARGEGGGQRPKMDTWWTRHPKDANIPQGRQVR